MASSIPTRKPTSGRKQWSINGNQEGSLKRLRNQLANDGCPESQYVLAMKLLEDDFDQEQEENARLGVYWLMKASEQGNIEATDMLKECFKSGRGITEHNYLDVKICIGMTQDEKVTRKAAKDMFASLSNGSDYITSIQLERRILEIEETACSSSTSTTNGATNGQLVNDNTHGDYGDQPECKTTAIDWTKRAGSQETNEKLTEDNLIAAAVNYAHGQMPAVNRALCLCEPNLNALDHIPVVHRALLHPILALKVLYYKLIRFLSLLSFKISTELRLTLLLLVYLLVGVDNPLYIAPLLVYYVTISVLVLCTCRMLQSNRDFGAFRLWSGLFITYSHGSNLNASQAEFQFIRANLKPYVHFFGALIVHLMCYPLVSTQSLPQSELALLSFLLTLMTLVGFLYRRRTKIIPDYLVLFSFGINVLAKYPYESDPVVTQGWRFLDLKIPTFASYIVGNGIEFCISFRILLYAFIPVIFVRLAARENWRGIYKYLIPHCVTLSWLQLVIISSQGATMFGIMRGTLALVGVVFFLPLVGLTTVLIPAVALTKWTLTTTTNHMYTFGIFLTIALVAAFICTLLAKSRFKNLTVYTQILFTVIGTYFLLHSVFYGQTEKNFSTDVKSISLEQYERFCAAKSDFSTRLNCAKLDGLDIHWEGYISQVEVLEISNSMKYFIDKLPEVIRNYMYCYYGDPVQSDCVYDDKNCIDFYAAVKYLNACSLDRYNSYKYLVTVNRGKLVESTIWGNNDRLDNSAKVHLVLSDTFRNVTKLLTSNDKIWYKGTLRDSLQNSNSAVLVRELGCIDCVIKTIGQQREDVNRNYSIEYLKHGFMAVLSFVFYPIVIFK